MIMINFIFRCLLFVLWTFETMFNSLEIGLHTSYAYFLRALYNNSSAIRERLKKTINAKSVDDWIAQAGYVEREELTAYRLVKLSEWILVFFVFLLVFGSICWIFTFVTGDARIPFGALPSWGFPVVLIVIALSSFVFVYSILFRKKDFYFNSFLECYGTRKIKAMFYTTIIIVFIFVYTFLPLMISKYVLV